MLKIARRMSKMEQQKRVSLNPIDFVIVTALEEEREAVLRKLPFAKQLPPSDEDIRVYYHSKLPVHLSDGSLGDYDLIVLSLLNMGRVEASTATSDAIRRWQPRFVLLVGIAGGIEDAEVNLGDILISNQIVDYELQKIREEGTSVRYVVHQAAPRLLNAAQNFNFEKCLELLEIQCPQEKTPKRFVGAIASGDKVIAFGDVLKKYQHDWPKLIGVEMEAAGVAHATFQAANPPGFFMVRGVSDLADSDKDTSDVKKWRSFACDVAAAYTVAFLQSGPIPFEKKN
jgi:nucleoside phosphorylase